jgi:diadenosine tetraphosphate (Ap4A) HIT family hydrolase
MGGFDATRCRLVLIACWARDSLQPISSISAIERARVAESRLPVEENFVSMKIADFIPDPRLMNDTVLVGELSLSRVLMMNDARFGWLILVPRRDGACEIADLAEADAMQLMREVRLTSAALRKISPCDKLNIASLGNMVPQLHVHVVARVRGDAAWPGPVFGVPGRIDLAHDVLEARCVALRAALGL